MDWACLSAGNSFFPCVEEVCQSHLLLLVHALSIMVRSWPKTQLWLPGMESCDLFLGIACHLLERDKIQKTERFKVRGDRIFLENESGQIF